MRNPRRELNEILFEYKPTSDTAEGIAQELLGTGKIGVFLPKLIDFMGVLFTTQYTFLDSIKHRSQEVKWS